MHDERTCPPRQADRFQRYRRNRRHTFAPPPPPQLHPIIRLLLIALLLLHAAVSPAAAAPADSVALQRLGLQSPTAASLGVYGDIPVDLYTGVPNIAIPLHTVQGRALSVPISLNYHAGGHKVNAMPSWAGLGWSLHAGGVITRTLRGLPDEHANGYANTGADLDNEWSNPSQQFKDELNAEERDAQPDLFFYNFLGRSGQFIWGPDDEFRTIPHEKLKIEWDATAESWTITTEDGTRFRFAEKETTTDASSTDGVMVDRPNLPYTSSWYLSAIYSPAGADSITFTYSSIGNIGQSIPLYLEKIYVIKNFGSCPLAPIDTLRTTITSTTDTKKLVSIVAALDSVVCKTSTRLGDGQHKLDSLIVYTNGTLRRKVQFDYGYFNDTAGQDSRLKLEAVQVIGRHGVARPPYTFTYNATKLPPRTSAAQDAWGYYNGKTGNTTLIPEHVETQVDSFYGGGDRHPDADFAKAAILEKITYPTGGTSTFTFEGNDYGYTGAKPVSGVATGMVDTLFAEDGNLDTLIISFVDSLNTDIGFDLNVQLNGIGAQEGYNAQVALINLVSGDTLINHITDTSFTANERLVVSASDSFKLVAKSYGEPDPDPVPAWAQARLRYYAKMPGKRAPAGGLRIKKIVHHDGIDTANDVVLTYSYRTAADTARSSGSIVNEPIFAAYQNENNCQLSRATTTQLPLGVTRGNHIGYSEVTVTFADGGSSRHTFRSPLEVQDLIPDAEDPGEAAKTRHALSFSAYTNFDWKRGQPVEQIDLNSAGNPVRRQRTTYVFKDADEPADSTDATRKFKALALKLIGRDSTNTPKNLYLQHTYEVYSSWTFADSTIVTDFPDGGSDSVQTVTTYAYDSKKHLQLSKIVETNSDNSRRVTRMRYPADFDNASSSGDDAVKALHDMTDSLHIHNAVVERLVYGKKSGENTKVHSAELSKFKDFSSSGPKQVLPQQRLVYRRDTLEDSTAFDLASVDTNASPDSVKYDGDYIIVESFDSYDAYGRRRQSRAFIDTSKKVATTIKWQGKFAGPSALFVDAAEAETFFEDFQNESTAGWSGSPAIANADRHDKVLKITGTTDKKRTMVVLSQGIFECDLMLLHDDANFDLELRNASGDAGVSLRWNSAGKIQYFGPLLEYLDIGDYAKYTWYHLRIVFDDQANTYDVIIDGEIVADDLSFPHSAYDEPEELRLAWNTSGKDAYIDNIRYYPAGALATAVTYDKTTGAVLSITDAAGVATHYRYDGLQRLRTTSAHDGALLATHDYYYSRDGNNDVFSSSDPNAVTIKTPSQSLLHLDFTYTDDPANHGWAIYDGTGSMSTVYDETRKSQVMRTTTGGGTGFGVYYDDSGLFDIAATHFWATIKDDDDFVLYVLVYADNDSNYYLTYHPIADTVYKNNEYINIGLGTEYKDGTWRTISRNLELDLQATPATDTLALQFVRRIYLRGDYDIDDLRLTDNPITTVTHLDGLGRDIQIRQRLGDDDIVNKIFYNTVSLVEKNYKPVLVSNPKDTFIVAMTGFDKFLESHYTQDPLRRPQKTLHYGLQDSIVFDYGAGDYASTTYRYEDVIDEGGNTVRKFFDKFGNEVATVQAVGEADSLRWHLGLDILGNLVAVFPPNYNQPPTGTSAGDWDSGMKVNTLGQLVERTTPDEGTSKYVYDHAGNLRFSQNAEQATAGRFTVFRYDAHNRVTHVAEELDSTWTTTPPSIYNVYGSDGDEWKVKHFYDANFVDGATNFSAGRLAKTEVNADSDSAAEHTIEYVYDAFGNLAEKHITIDGGSPVSEKSLYITYDLLGRETQVVYPSGNTVIKQYDQAGRLHKVVVVE